MKRLLILAVSAICATLTFAGEVIILTPPIGRIGDESLSLISSNTLSSRLLKKTTLVSTTYSPVSAIVDEVALTVTFTESVGIANVLVYDANNQLVDMVTVDTSNVYEAVLATDAWTSGSYKLVITYGVTTLEGSFNF
jgi:hypothetical protein